MLSIKKPSLTNLIARSSLRLGWCLCLGFLLVKTSAQSPSEFLSVQYPTNHEAVLKFKATKGKPYRIDTSANLSDWSSLSTLVAATTNQYIDTATPYLAARAYRVVELEGTNNITGDQLATAEGDIVFHPINHATFIMGWNGKVIYNDPVGGAARFTGLPRPDIILISHDHSDHFDALTLAAVKGTNTVILAPRIVYNSLSAALKAITTVLTNNSSTNLMGMSIAAIPAYNLTQSYHPKGVGNGYVVTIAGKRIYIAGDTEDISEMRTLADIDVAFVCVNLPFTMSVPKAVSAIRAFRPKVVYPYHYTGTSTTDMTLLKKQIGTDLGIEVRQRAWY